MALIRRTRSNFRFRATRGGGEGSRNLTVVLSYTEGEDDYEDTYPDIPLSQIQDWLTQVYGKLNNEDIPGVPVDDIPIDIDLHTRAD